MKYREGGFWGLIRLGYLSCSSSFRIALGIGDWLSYHSEAAVMAGVLYTLATFSTRKK